MNRETGDGEEHYGDFEDFGPDGDGAFAEAVGEISAHHREKDEWQREEQAHFRVDVLLLLGGNAGANNEKEDEVFQGVVAECALKLRDDQAPESTLPVLELRH